ncbi:unnamed protein product [Cylicocyclus nassatus]|uniref:Secreted protein n=1 Tax=Cylicocyclus nassatus TaxID=53992 RepID=A0AA36H6K4_CYLNA|nr:unnamed protein product [Cylicocyclus nassatus]
MHTHMRCFLFFVMLVCCSSNLFIGRMSTRPSAGKRSIQKQRISDVACSLASMEFSYERMHLLQKEEQAISYYLAQCKIAAQRF